MICFLLFYLFYSGGKQKAPKLLDVQVEGAQVCVRDLGAFLPIYNGCKTKLPPALT